MPNRCPTICFAKQVACMLMILSTSCPSLAATTEQIRQTALQMVCLCGDCNRESLATCICTFAEEKRKELGAALDSGLHTQQIIDAAVLRYGHKILATPPTEGYNLLAWFMPFVVLLGGIVFLRKLLRRWRYNPGPICTTGALQDTDSRYSLRLQHELDHYNRE